MNAPKFQSLSSSSDYFKGISEVLIGQKIKNIEISDNFRILRVITEDDSKLEVESPEELTVFRTDKDDKIVNIGALDFFEKLKTSWEW